MSARNTSGFLGDFTWDNLLFHFTITSCFSCESHNLRGVFFIVLPVTVQDCSLYLTLLRLLLV